MSNELQFEEILYPFVPRMRLTDHAIRRHLIIVPFNSSFLKSNNSISAYEHTRDGALWISDIYETVCKFLAQEDKHNVWIAHKTYPVTVKPNAYKYKTRQNPEYIMWTLQNPQKTILPGTKSYRFHIYAQLQSETDLYPMT